MNFYQPSSPDTIAVAVDIGTTKICAIAGRMNEYGRLDVLAFGHVASEGVARGVVSNVDKTVKAIREAVSIAEAHSGYKFKKVHVGIAGQHIKSLHQMGYRTRTDRNSEITKDDVENLIKEMYKTPLPPGDKILHIIPQEFSVDDEKNIVDPIGMSGYKLEANFHVITGQISASKNIVKCVQKAGLEIANLTLEPIASSASVLSKEEKEAGVVLVDIGGGTTDISIFKDNIIRHTAVVPLGGNIITEDIKKGCTVLKDQAEKLKVRYGSALASEIVDNRRIVIQAFKGRDPKSISEKNLAMIVQARVEEIFDHVLWEIKRSGYDKDLVAGIVLTGGGALLKNIDSLVQYHTGMHARVGEPTEYLAQGFTKELTSPKFATAIGLLKYTIDNMEENFAMATLMEDEASSRNLFGGSDNTDGDESAGTVGVEPTDDPDVPPRVTSVPLKSLKDEDNPENKSMESRFMNVFRKVKSYTADFFEPTPDHEL